MLPSVDAMAWALFFKGISFLPHYLDDFLFVLPSSSLEVMYIKDKVIAVFGKFGSPVATDKSEGPCINVSYLPWLLAGQESIPVEAAPGETRSDKGDDSGMVDETVVHPAGAGIHSWTPKSCCVSSSS